MGRNSHKKYNKIEPVKKDDAGADLPPALLAAILLQDPNAHIQPNPATTAGSGQEALQHVEEREVDLAANKETAAAAAASGQEEAPRVEEGNANVAVNDDRQREATAAGDDHREYDSEDDWVNVDDNTTRQLAQARFVAEPTEAWFLVENETDGVTEARAHPANATHEPEDLPEQHLMGATLSSGGSTS
jgi:hypothetical protein